MPRSAFLNIVAFLIASGVFLRAAELPPQEADLFESKIRPILDPAEGIKGNLQGLEWIQKEMRQPGLGRPIPREPTPPVPVVPKPASSASPQNDPLQSRHSA